MVHYSLSLNLVPYKMIFKKYDVMLFSLSLLNLFLGKTKENLRSSTALRECVHIYVCVSVCVFVGGMG